MIILKSGYFIDELSEFISSCTSKEIFKSFYSSNTYFKIDNLSTDIDFDNVNPLLKVAWNIIARGDITRASLKLSRFILKDIFQDLVLEFNFTKPEISSQINFVIEKNSNVIIELLKKFSTIGKEIFPNQQSHNFKIYQGLNRLIQFSQIHRTILLIMMKNPTGTSIKINGVSKIEQKIIIEDMNDLFTNLNKLVSNNEIQIPLLQKNPNNGITISIDPSFKDGIIIDSFIQETDTLNLGILTDRRISYKQLGKVVEFEVDENGEKKQKQKFEYKTKKQKRALRFFLNNIFRKSDFMAGQEAIINRALVGKDVIGLLPTGGGKSLTYQLCALLHPGVTIVVDPINSLMKDQFDNLIDNGITKTTFINSFNTKSERIRNIQNLVYSQYLIIFVSPERFQIKKFRNSLANCRNANVYFSYAVIDEAHCVSEWGHDFRHVYLNLAKNLRCHCFSKNDDLALFGLTATASFDVLADVQRELELKEDAIINLPAEAIDRKELNFNVIQVDLSVDDKLSFWEREKKLGEVKYPILKEFLKQIPSKINQIEKDIDDKNLTRDFYEKRNDKFTNAGVIFCPTKSNKLANGVLHLKDELKKLQFLEISTFFSCGDDNTITDKRIDTEAKQSVQNQEIFLQDDSNLMIATKAFGMGIDKPNIRYSIHYSFSNSIESFYQEAGRAGRNGKPSICSIIYHPLDIKTNYDFYSNAFKGIKREQEIIKELLDEVQYENGFFLNILKSEIQDKFPEVHNLNLWKDRYLYINGPWKKVKSQKITIGCLDLERNLKSYDNATNNFNLKKAAEILRYVRKLLKQKCPDKKYIDWLKTKSTGGINTLLKSGKNQKYHLKVGFSNAAISKMNEIIINIGYVNFEERIIRASYNFSKDENDFIDRLKNKYYKWQKNKGVQNIKDLLLKDDTIKYLKQNYYKIRNSSDTMRAIYRMNVVGIIDDYVIDYANRFIEIQFRKKKKSTYILNFNNYLRRYLGIETTKEWLDKIDGIKEESFLMKILSVLINFIDSEISDKRKRSIDYMQELCEVFLSDGEMEFRDRMIRYFTSKYARNDYLPADTEKGTKENCEIVVKYIKYIFNPPDGLGGQIDNAKHLRGACDNLRINMVDNASIDLLTSFSLLALELEEQDTVKSANDKPLVQQAITLYRKGFKRMIKIDSWQNVISLIDIFNKKVIDFNSAIKPLMDKLSTELLVNRTSYKLNNFLNKMTK